jgi:hypothetical protein
MYNGYHRRYQPREEAHRKNLSCRNISINQHRPLEGEGHGEESDPRRVRSDTIMRCRTLRTTSRIGLRRRGRWACTAEKVSYAVLVPLSAIVCCSNPVNTSLSWNFQDKLVFTRVYRDRKCMSYSLRMSLYPRFMDAKTSSRIFSGRWSQWSTSL